MNLSEHRYEENMNSSEHRHANLILEKQRQDEAGETANGWWLWEGSTEDSSSWISFDKDAGPKFGLARYRYTATNKHPGYVK